MTKFNSSEFSKRVIQMKIWFCFIDLSKYQNVNVGRGPVGKMSILQSQPYSFQTNLVLFIQPIELFFS